MQMRLDCKATWHVIPAMTAAKHSFCCLSSCSFILRPHPVAPSIAGRFWSIQGLLSIMLHGMVETSHGIDFFLSFLSCCVVLLQE